MKKTLCLVAVLFVFIISNVSCAVPESYLVKTVTTHLGTCAVIENRYFYDEKGRVAGYRIYQDGDHISTVEYGYDEDGHLVYERLNSPIVDYVSETFSEVDEHGRPTSQRYVVRYDGGEVVKSWTIEYVDENGSYVERTVIDGVELTQRCDYDEHGNLLHTEMSDGVITEYANEYSEDGTLLRVVITVDGSSTVTEYEYSEEGDYTIERLYDSRGELVRTRELFYSKTPPREELKEPENNDMG